MNFYPPSPKQIKSDYTKLPIAYNLKALLAVFSVILFFLLYIGLVIVLALLTKWAFTYTIEDVNRFSLLGKAGACLGSTMLFLFTLKFIFKIRNFKPENRIKLQKQEQQSLWAFVDRICAETGAPKPKDIYVDPDVNAYVSYSNTWLSLILPVKKDLTIGLGLVSCLNLSEFKAVISHEFGHFSQSSMRIGSYITSANTIIHDMIFNRDKWDELLDKWRQMDLRISFAAWVITPIVWVIRLILRLFYQLLNVMYSLLSREMEFNADRVAAKTSGSDAIVSALWKLNHGAQNWNTSVNHLYNANTKGISISNVYSHHTTVSEKSNIKLKELTSSLEDHPNGGKQYFINDEVSKVNMYASHPPNNSREENVKSPYINCELDYRSPWLLFDKKEKIQEQCTSVIYKDYFQIEVKENSNIEAFQSFVEQESKGLELLDNYMNTYKDRYLIVSDMESQYYEELETSQLVAHAKNLKDELMQLHTQMESIDNTIMALNKIAEGTSKTPITYADKKYNKKNINEGYNALFTAKTEMLNNQFTQWDQKQYTIHRILNKRLQVNDQFEDLINQHQSITHLYKSFVEKKEITINYLAELQENNEITEDNIFTVARNVADIGRDLNKIIKEFDIKNYVPLSNLESLEVLLLTIIPGKQVKTPYGNMFSNNSYNEYIQTLEYGINQLNRIDQKSIIEILTVYEEIIEQAK